MAAEVLPLPLLAERLPLPPPPGLDPLLARADLAPAIQEALDEIPETFRSAVVLVDLEDQSYEDAANVLESVTIKHG